jgi:tetratricopeptide (TPR) repeat protein
MCCVLWSFGFSNFLSQNFVEAIRDCDEVLSLDSANMKALFRRAKGQMGLKNFEQAIVDLQLLIEKDPSNDSFNTLLAEADSLQQRQREVQLKLNSEKLKLQGNEAMSKGRFLEAKELFSNALGLWNNNIAARSNRILANLKLKLFEEAEIDATKLLSMSPTVDESIQKKTLFRRAEAYYNQAMETPSSDPSKTVVLLQRANVDVLHLLSKDGDNVTAKTLLSLIESSQKSLVEVDSRDINFSLCSENGLTPTKSTKTISAIKSPPDVSPLLREKLSARLEVLDPPKTLYE